MYDKDSFFLSSDVKGKLKDNTFIEKQLMLGLIPQEVLEVSDEVMAKLYQKARSLFEKENFIDSANAFLFLSTLNPNCFEYWLGLGMSLQRCQEYYRAIDAYELAVHADITNPASYFYLAKCFFAIHDRENSLEALELAIEMANDQDEFTELKHQALAAKKLILLETGET